MASPSSHKYTLWGSTDLAIEIPPDVFPDEAWRSSEDELFDHPTHGFFPSCHNHHKNKPYRLHYRKNLPPTGIPIRAIVVWQHGICGQSGFGMRLSNKGSASDDDDDSAAGKGGRYTDMALRVRQMNAQGIAVYAHDQLGHGFSEGHRFYIPNGKWSVNRDDLVAFCQLAASEHDEGTPLFVSGDSYGGCLALHTTLVFQEQPDLAPKGFRGCTLNCPAIHGDFPPTPVVWMLRYGLAPFFPTRTPFFMPHPITSERVWKEDEARAHFCNRDEMHGLSQAGTPFCLGTAAGLVGAMQAVQALIPTMRIPFHVAHGTDDYGVPLSGSEFLMKESQTVSADKVLNAVQGGYHGLFSQLDAEDTINQEIEWIQSIIQRQQQN